MHEPGVRPSAAHWLPENQARSKDEAAHPFSPLYSPCSRDEADKAAMQWVSAKVRSVQKV